MVIERPRQKLLIRARSRQYKWARKKGREGCRGHMPRRWNLRSVMAGKMWRREESKTMPRFLAWVTGWLEDTYKKKTYGKNRFL